MELELYNQISSHSETFYNIEMGTDLCVNQKTQICILINFVV